MNSQPNLSQVLVRTKGNGEVTYYVYGLGLIGEQSAGNYFSYLFDYRGSTVAITDTTGQIIDTVQYSPFGVVLSQPTFDTPFLFNGLYGVMTDDNSLSYMRARYYSADIRRFVNQDVLLGNVADGQSLNRFAFVTGNPVSFVDPFGLLGTSASCQCKADINSKAYNYTNEKWWGFTREWTCKFTCTTVDKVTTSTIEGTENDWFIWDSGLEGICRGANYNQVWNRMTNEFVWMNDPDNEATSFDPKNCGIPELEKWASENECP